MAIQVYSHFPSPTRINTSIIQLLLPFFPKYKSLGQGHQIQNRNNRNYYDCKLAHPTLSRTHNSLSHQTHKIYPKSSNWWDGTECEMGKETGDEMDFDSTQHNNPFSTNFITWKMTNWLLMMTSDFRRCYWCYWWYQKQNH